MSEDRPRVRVFLEVGPAGAAQGAARGDVVIVVDALRASATITAALHVGALCVVPVRTVPEAEAYLGVPGTLVAGERGGAKPSTFDLGNSPVQIVAEQSRVAGSTLVLTTSNGTQCVDVALTCADVALACEDAALACEDAALTCEDAALLIGSTVNAHAVADAAMALATERGSDITVLAAGLDGQAAQEDTYAQALIATRLIRRGATSAQPVPLVSEDGSSAAFLGSEAARRLTELGYVEDIALCARIDVWDTVPVYRTDGFRRLHA